MIRIALSLTATVFVLQSQLSHAQQPPYYPDLRFPAFGHRPPAAPIPGTQHLSQGSPGTQQSGSPGTQGSPGTHHFSTPYSASQPPTIGTHLPQGGMGVGSGGMGVGPGGSGGMGTQLYGGKSAAGGMGTQLYGGTSVQPRASGVRPSYWGNPAFGSQQSHQTTQLNQAADSHTAASDAGYLQAFYQAHGQLAAYSAPNQESPAGDGLLDGSALGGSDSNDSLAGMGPATGGIRSPHGAEVPLRTGVPEGQDPHIGLFLENCYPSALTCAKCHPKVYEEWRTSAHAYAGISPMFHKFEQALTQLSAGTLGTFCMRCHAPVAMHVNFPREGSVVDHEHVLREGVTCVVCHRVREAYNRHNGERRIEPGSIFDPVYGASYGEGLAKAIAEKEKYKIKVDPNDRGAGQQIHLNAIKFDQLSDSSFCASCHQVAVHPGIALEVVWAQYRAGPACKKGISCQDCHMGVVPGKPSGYANDYVAEIGGKPVNEPRKHASHMFWGPITPISHPGLFPHNEKSLRWKIDDWLSFDWRAGWGTEAFERSEAAKQTAFPACWNSSDERRDARKVIDANLALLAVKRESSVAVMEAGSQVDGPYFKHKPKVAKDLQFHFAVKNISEGHNMPSGSLGAQPQLWLNVVLINPSGCRIWESGYLDSNGDLCNHHSIDVTQGRVPADLQLFNLQTQFLITGVKGTDREMYLPINVDIDQLPFLRPGAQPITVLNHPPFIRMEAHSIPPLGQKIARYRVPAELLTEPGTYRMSVRLRSRMEPIYFMRFVNATPEMEQWMIENTLDLHPYSIQFTIE